MSINKLNAVDIKGPFTSVGTVTTTETTLGTANIQPQSFTDPTSVLRVLAFGTVANNANAKTLKFYIGATSQSFTLQASVANSWRFEAYVVSNGSASQKSNATVICGISSGSTSETFTISSTENDLANIVVKLTGTATTTNDIVCTGCLFFT